MKSAVLNVSIDTEKPEGERLRDMILSNEFKDGWLVVSWIDRTKYNPVELLKQSEESRMKAVEEAIRLNDECEKMSAWIEKAKYLMAQCEPPKQFSDLIDEAPI